MDDRTRKYMRWVIIAICLIYVVYLHLQRAGYRKKLDMILKEAHTIEGSAYYEAAPKELKQRVKRIGSISSDVLNIPSQENTLRDVADRSR
ncbi:MAG: hypothetical protein GF392_03960 [Candidatus Omnitrophica bacterium]|nr:hypothetical protein [Candidatus Omnitrophota bacterium]